MGSKISCTGIRQSVQSRVFLVRCCVEEIPTIIADPIPEAVSAESLLRITKGKSITRPPIRLRAAGVNSKERTLFSLVSLAIIAGNLLCVGGISLDNIHVK